MARIGGPSIDRHRNEAAMTGLLAEDIQDFNAYLAKCTDSQVTGVYAKERDAGRAEFAELARAEADKRGIADQCAPSS
jgi:hypothetical protein